jgi:hypothetical protein
MYSHNKNYLMNSLGSAPFSRPFQVYSNADMVAEEAILLKSKHSRRGGALKCGSRHH